MKFYHIFSVVEYVEDFYGLYRNANGATCDSDLSNDDSDDSNDENNWRNDYPEDEEADRGSSICENEMRKAMEDFDIGKKLLMFLRILSDRNHFKSLFYTNEANPFMNRRFFWTCKD